jgi:hypothetical protein
MYHFDRCLGLGIASRTVIEVVHRFLATSTYAANRNNDITFRAQIIAVIDRIKFGLASESINEECTILLSGGPDRIPAEKGGGVPADMPVHISA